MSKKTKLSELVFEKLRSMVLRNELKVGSYYLEQELAERLGTSRTPLREAAIRLEQEGLVNIIPRRGIYVRPVSAQEMREIYEVLTWLESAAISAACRRPIPAESLEELERTHADMQTALEKGDLTAWAYSDKRFHQTLVELSSNLELINLVNNYWDKTDRVRTMTLRIRNPPAQSTEDHRNVIEALKNRDADLAIALNMHHRQRASDELTTLLDVLDTSYG